MSSSRAQHRPSRRPHPSELPTTVTAATAAAELESFLLCLQSSSEYTTDDELFEEERLESYGVEVRDWLQVEWIDTDTQETTVSWRQPTPPPTCTAEGCDQAIRHMAHAGSHRQPARKNIPTPMHLPSAHTCMQWCDVCLEEALDGECDEEGRQLYTLRCAAQMPKPACTRRHGNHGGSAGDWIL